MHLFCCSTLLRGMEESFWLRGTRALCDDHQLQHTFQDLPLLLRRGENEQQGIGQGLMGPVLRHSMCTAQIHRLIGPLRLEKTTKVTTSNHQPPCPMATSLSATSPLLLNTSRDANITTSLGSLCQCTTTLSEKKFFLLSHLNLPWHILRPLTLIPVT